MSDSRFLERVRGVLQTPGRDRPGSSGPGGDPASAFTSNTLSLPSPSDGRAGLEQALGGAWREGSGPRCFAVETVWEGTSRHGGDTVATMASRFEESIDGMPLLVGAPVEPPLIFLDLETTGLSGGAGTLAFLVGCGWFDGARFVTRQYLLPHSVDERAVLTSVASELGRAGALVTFNGKSFDAPVLETRYLFHRLEWVGGGLPHLDMLHLARRFWRREAREAFQTQNDDAGCSLGALERQILGAARRADIPSFEIPSRYFHFVRTGDARPLAPVFVHNRIDLLSLAALTSRALNLIRVGPGRAADAREALALGRVYSRAGLVDRSQRAYERAIELSGRDGRSGAYLEAMRELALALRRSRRHHEAAECWRSLLEASHCPPRIACEASEALAIHHEHRLRDFGAAKAFALRSLDHQARSTWQDATHYRLARLERKMAAANEARLDLEGGA